MRQPRVFGNRLTSTPVLFNMVDSSVVNLLDRLVANPARRLFVEQLLLYRAGEAPGLHDVVS